MLNGTSALAYCPRIRGPLLAAAMYIARATSGIVEERIGPYVIRAVNDELEVVDSRTRQVFKVGRDLLWVA